MFFPIKHILCSSYGSRMKLFLLHSAIVRTITARTNKEGLKFLYYTGKRFPPVFQILNMYLSKKYYGETINFLKILSLSIRLFKVYF